MKHQYDTLLDKINKISVNNNNNVNNNKVETVTKTKKKSKKKQKTEVPVLDKHSSNIKSNNVDITARLLNDEGRVYKRVLMRNKTIYMFGVYLDYRSKYKLKNIDVILKTPNGNKVLKASVGENRYEVDGEYITNGVDDVIVRVYYSISMFKYNYKEIKLRRKYD